MNDSRIDFVLPWVDGGDALWQAELLKHKGLKPTVGDASTIRYRDWESLQYWFRAVEQFAPWVGKIHFVTWGHLPPWLNTDHPKLNVVRHEDYIPKEYLPTFSSHPIELNIHRIEGLAERFVYFNDDTFLLRPTPAERFFKRGLPVDTARLAIIAPGSISHIVLNDVQTINRRHQKSLNGHLGKWFSPRYTISDMIKTLTLAPWDSYAGFKDTHMPQPFLRSTFQTMWQQEHSLLDATSRNAIRSLSDVNQYLMRYEQLVTGSFTPTGYGDTHLDSICQESIDNICNYITKQLYTMTCLNDSDKITNFEALRERLNAAFETILPNKSSYEL